MKAALKSFLRIMPLRLIIAASVVWLLFYFVWIRPLSPTANLRRYEELVGKNMPEDSATAHFPKRIPSSASTATFYYLPGAFQGSTIIRLRLTLPSSEVMEIFRQLQSRHTLLTADDAHNLIGWGIPRIGMKTRWFSKKLNDGFEPMPTDFVSFLVSPDDLETAKKNWNHPDNFGISVSLTRNEVIYWYN